MIATPPAAAQVVCDRLVQAGVECILNFAPVVLQVPETVEVRKVDLAVELQILSFHVARRADSAPTGETAPAPRANSRVGGRRPRPRHRDERQRGGGPEMSVLAVGISHRSADVRVLERATVPRRRDRQGPRRAAALRERRRGRARHHVQPGRGLHGRAGLPRRSRGRRRRARPALRPRRRGAVRAPVRALRGRRGRAPVPGDRRASTRWSSASRRSSARSAPRTTPRARPAPSAARCTSCSSARCGSASGSTPRPASTRPAARSSPRRWPTPTAALGGLAGRRALIVGAGSMGGLAAAALRRAGIGEIVIANRTEQTGARLAELQVEQGTPARAVGLADLAATPRAGRRRRLVHRRDRHRDRREHGRPAGPARWSSATSACRATWPPTWPTCRGVTIVDLESLQRRLAARRAAWTPRRAATIVADEVRAYLATQRSAEVTPTVTALRRRAAEVVDAELLRLDSRLRPGRRRSAPRWRRRSAAWSTSCCTRRPCG